MAQILNLSERTYQRALRELSDHVVELTALAHEQAKLAEESRVTSLRAQAICSRLACTRTEPKAA